PYDTLLQVYWHNVDPFDDGGQFCDRGSPYRPGIFVSTPAERAAAEESKAKSDADAEAAAAESVRKAFRPKKSDAIEAEPEQVEPAPKPVTVAPIEEPVAQVPVVEDVIPEPEPEPAPVLNEVTPEDAFITPKAAVPGEPSEDTIRRLQAAVAKQPERPTMAPPRVVAETPEPAAQEPEGEDRSRFAINTLIHRMTGTAEREAPAAPRAPTAGEDLDDAERARIEIPAFLRRQAN
ncbi:MAG: peptide-methionine (S)-S-oxide reductase, partial [Pseudomonadota bacterium]